MNPGKLSDWMLKAQQATVFNYWNPKATPSEQAREELNMARTFGSTLREAVELLESAHSPEPERQLVVEKYLHAPHHVTVEEWRAGQQQQQGWSQQRTEDYWSQMLSRERARDVRAKWEALMENSDD